MATNGEFISVLDKNALKDLREANTEVTSLIANINKAGTAMQGVKSPSGSNSAIKSLKEDYDKVAVSVNKMQNELTKQASIQQNNIEKTRLAEIRLQQQREKSFDSYDKQARREQAQVEKISGLYQKTQQAVNSVTATYNNLAIKKALGNELTIKEQIQLTKLTKDLNIYQTALKKVDADIQKNGRNVGNYASHWNGLGNSINQLTREAPAFAVSLNTGFLALSNNLPILFDEINKITTANKELLKTGKPVQSAFSQIAGALFSWQTALSVGVTLLTLYGGKIIDSISGSAKRKAALEEEKKAIEEKVNAERQQNESIGQSIASEQNRARILFEIAKNTEVSDKKRKEALDEIRDRYSKYLGDLTNQQILAGDTADAEERLNKALIGRGYALATQNLLEKNLTEQMAAQVEYQKAISKSNIFNQVEEQRNADGSIKNIEKYNKALREANKINQSALSTLNAKLEPLKEEENVLLGLFQSNAKYLDSVNEVNKAKEKKNKVSKEELEIESNSRMAFEKNIAALEKSLANTKALDLENGELSQTYTIQRSLLELLKKTYDELFGSIEKVQEATDGIELSDEQVQIDEYRWKKLHEATLDYLSTIRSGFIEQGLDSIGFASLKMFTDFDEKGQSTFDKLIEGAKKGKEEFAVYFNSIGDIAQDTFNKIFELSNAQFENQLINLTKERDVALLFAGESATAKEEIEKQYQEKQKAIKRKQFQAEKQQALFNIAIDGAQAIVATLASTPLPAGLPLVIATGAITAAQLAFTAAQKIPEFWTGTDNAPAGLAWTNERGREIVTDRNYNVKDWGTDKGATLMNLSAGDKVFDAKTSAMMFDNGLNDMLRSNGIVMQNNIDVRPIVDAINNKAELSQVFDSNGIRTYIKKGNTIKERSTFTGKSV